MKFSISAKVLKDGITIAARSRAKKSSLPVLENIFISTLDAGHIKFVSTNLTVRCELPLDARVENMGATTANAEELREVMKRISNKNTITLELVGNQLRLSSPNDDVDTYLYTTDVSKCPPPPPPSETKIVEIPSNQFLVVFGRVAHVADTRMTRPELCGVSVTKSCNSLRAVATDGFHLATQTVYLKEEYGALDYFSTIIPRQALIEAVKLVKKIKPASVTLSQDDDIVTLTIGIATLHTWIIEKNYPDCDQLLPDTRYSIARVEVSAKKLLQMCKTIKEQSKNKFGILRVSVDGEAMALTLVSKADVVDAQPKTESISGCGGSGIETDYGVNINHLMAMSRILDKNSVRLNFFSVDAGVAFTGAPLTIEVIGEGDNFKYITMSGK